MKLDPEALKKLTDDCLERIAGGAITEYGWHPDCGGKTYKDTDTMPGEWLIFCEKCGYVIDASFFMD